MKRFISTAGPDKAPLDGIDVRFWGSKATLDEARKLKRIIDKQPELNAKSEAPLRTYIGRSLVRNDRRTMPKVFARFASMQDAPYVVMYIDDDSRPDVRPFDRLRHTEIGFDVFSAPIGADWHAVCVEATQIFRDLSSGPPGSQV
ncbi:MAG TPA: hypothetical protein VK550_19720 [Polyangiaceae bacterium]|nr:hypothetical protein [Polyangiaceae bacterium]